MRSRFTHCALHVRDLQKSVDFYREFCGLVVVQEHGEGPNDHAIWVSEPDRMSDYVFVLLLGGSGHDQPASDLSHFGFALESKADVDAIAERGRGAGCLAWEPGLSIPRRLPLRAARPGRVHCRVQLWLAPGTGGRLGLGCQELVTSKTEKRAKAGLDPPASPAVGRHHGCCRKRDGIQKVPAHRHQHRPKDDHASDP